MHEVDLWRKITRRAIRATLLVTLVFPSATIAAPPHPPCEGAAIPFYAKTETPAFIRTWQATSLPDPWIPPACLGWRVRGFAAIVAVAGRIGGISDNAQILKRLISTNAISRIRYWSFSRKTWRNLFSEVHTLAGPDRNLKRTAFGIEEIKTGQKYFMWQKENSIASGMVLEGQFNHLSTHKIVFEQVNLSPSHVLWSKVLAPREFETTYFLEKESAVVWRYYSLTRFGAVERPLSDGQLASVINRSVAIYRYLAGVSQDREPPAAP